MARRKRIKNQLGPVVELTFPRFALAELAELIDDWRTPLDTVLNQLRQKRRRGAPEALHQNGGRVIRKLTDKSDERGRMVFAQVRAWEKGSGQRLPAGHVVVLIDGDASNLQFENLYCLPRRELIGWMAFARRPIEHYVERMEKEIMSLDTSEAVKKQLIRILDQLADPNQKPDIVRQRAICETVQTMVGLLRVEVAYIRAIEGDGVVPFLEAAHEEAVKRQAATRRALFPSPPPNHPWRGLGNREGG